MPTTVNGVGTHYYGKSNRTIRSGVCRSCGVSTSLESYDTTLWFVVIFIPLIPLGRKRIVDQCSRCSRHFVADRAKYERAKQENVSAALEQYRSQPTPEMALTVHASLLSFQMYDEADKFRQSALLDHSQDAEMFLVLASHMAQVGRGDESLRLLDAAYALRPDLPDARVGAARIRIRDGRLREARELLDFLEQPRAGQQHSLEPLETLAIAYQKAGQHDQTLVLCKHLLSELPKIGHIAAFRKLVANSERALGGAESILPPKSFSFPQMFGGSNGDSPWKRRLTWAAIIAGVALLILAGLNEHWRRNRNVVAMNDCGQPVQMAIDGGPAVSVEHTSKLSLAEGQHHIKISGPINEEFDVDMATGYFERFAKSPVWVIMAGQGTVLAEDTIHYAKNPRPGQSKMIGGKNFYYAPHVDYCFTAPPRQLQAESGTSEVTKTVLHAASQPSHVLMACIAAEDVSAALRFGETRLIGHPDDVQLSDLYVLVAESAKQTDRAKAFFKQGLDRQPISVPWHRAYQNAAMSGGGEAVIEKEYDELLKKSPRDARMLYLTGRVAGDPKKGSRLFHESCDADPDFAWPCYALAYDAASSGDWRTCRRMAEKAFARIEYPAADELAHQARLALGDFNALEQECRQKMVASPGSSGHVRLDLLLDLYEVLLMQDRIADARTELANWQVRGSALPAENESCRLFVEYMNGDFSSPPDAGNSDVEPYTANVRLHCLLAGGRVKDAVADATLVKLLAGPADALAASVAWELAGNRREAAAWREKAAAAADQGDRSMKRAAALLRAAKPPTASQLDDVVVPPQYKCLLVAALMQRFPEQKSILAPLAKKLNVGRKPPYQLVCQAVEGAAAGPRKAGDASP